VTRFSFAAELLLVVALFCRQARSDDADLRTQMAHVVYGDCDYRRYACHAEDCTFDEFRKHIAFRRETLRSRPMAVGYFVEPTDIGTSSYTGFFVVRTKEPVLQFIFMGIDIGIPPAGGERNGFKVVVGTERTDIDSWTHRVFAWNGSKYVEISSRTYHSD
jgi:hypothetical protein